MDMRVSEFLIRQVVHKDIRYYSYKMKTGQFLSQPKKDKGKERVTKLLNKFKHPFQSNMLCSFSDERFLPGSEVELIKQPWWNRNTQSTSWCSLSLVTNDSDVMPPLIFLHGFNTEAYRECSSGLRGWLLADSMSGNRTLRHATQAREPSLDWKKISATTSPLTSGRLTPQITILWI